jgi:TatA/E family protein of Tat protein translocase
MLGTGELLVILLLALILFGPKKIPEIAKSLGKAVKEMERVKTELEESVKEELKPARFIEEEKEEEEKKLSGD